jgi:Ca-activated chloride channel family protein
MSGPWHWHFAEGAWLHALWSVPIAVGLAWSSFRRRRRAVLLFAGSAKRGPVGVRTAIKAGLFAVALACAAIAVARPQGDEKEETVTLRGRDLVFLVDVSRSMLATDVVPTRLERAKLWINDLTKSLKGDRVALVAFAGSSSVKCPLTLDYSFFRLALAELSPRSVARGGTLIGDAIRKAMTQVFDGTPGRFRDIILITDGEDHESFPVQAAEQAGEQGVRIIAVGIGSEGDGALVPGGEESGREYLEYEGQRVRSAMDAGSLSQIATASAGGVFLNVGTGTIDLEQVYTDLIAGAEKNEIGTKSIKRYEELFQIVLAWAVLLLIVESLIDDRRR